MYSIASRIKTDGTYINCPKTDKEFKSYGNKVEDKTFNSIDDAIKFIKKSGDRSRVYYIFQEYNPSFDIHNRNNPVFDGGNNQFVRQRYG